MVEQKKTNRKFSDFFKTLREIFDIPHPVLVFTLSLLVVGAFVGVVIFFRFISGVAGPPGGDEQRLELLKSDPMYSVNYPGAVELSRAERGSQGFFNGLEQPPRIMYFAGTNDGDDDKIIQFFIDAAIENGWEISRGPSTASVDYRIIVIFEKSGVGTIFLRLFDTEKLNRILSGEKVPTEKYETIITFTIEAEHEDPPWPWKK